jgi:hypothetical protein
MGNGIHKYAEELGFRVSQRFHVKICTSGEWREKVEEVGFFGGMERKP